LTDPQSDFATSDSGRMLADDRHWSFNVVLRRHLVWILQSVRGFSGSKTYISTKLMWRLSLSF